MAPGNRAIMKAIEEWIDPDTVEKRFGPNFFNLKVWRPILSNETPCQLLPYEIHSLHYEILSESIMRMFNLVGFTEKQPKHELKNFDCG